MAKQKRDKPLLQDRYHRDRQLYQKQINHFDATSVPH